MKKKHFTLVELLVVIGIIVLLAGMLLPAVNSARKRATALDCLNQIRQITAAAILYSNDNRHFMPCNGTGVRVNNTTVYTPKTVVDWWWTEMDGTKYYEWSWAGKLYQGKFLNEPSSYICKDAMLAPQSSSAVSDKVWLYSDRSKPALSYSILHEISIRSTIKLDKPSHAIYLFDNDYTSSCSISEYVAKSSDERDILNTSLTHSKENNIEGQGFRDAFKTFGDVHNGKINAGFVDGHANPFEPVDLIDKCIAYKSNDTYKLYDDYKRR